MSKLSVEQLKMVNAVWRVNESMWPDLMSASIKRYGVAPPKLDATPFEVNGVQLSGGHMRLYYDSLEVEIKNEQKQGERRASVVTPKPGSLHARVGSGGRPVLLDRNNIARSLEENIHFIAYAENGQHIRRLINARDIKATIERKHGRPFARELINQLDQLIGNTPQTFTPLDPLFRLFRQAATYRHLVFSVRNVVQQTSAFPIAMQEVGPINYINAITKLTTQEGTAEFVKSKSAFMRNRTSLVNREAAEYLDNITVDGPAGHAYEQMKRVGFTPQTVIDAGIAHPLWLARYEIAINEHGDERLAASQADASVAESVGSGHDLHLGNAFNSNSSEFLRTVTIFGSWFNAYYNRVYRDTHGFDARQTFLTGQGLNAVFTMPMIVALISSALVYDFPDSDDPEDWAKWAASRYAAFIAGTIPIIRDIVSFATSGFAPKTVLAGAQEGPYRIIQETDAFFEGRQSGLKYTSDVIKVGSTFVPIFGAGQVTRMMDYTDSYLQGNEGRTFNVPQMLVEGPNRNKESQ